MSELDLARKPVRTLEELDQLNTDEIVEGYFDGRDGDVISCGDNRSKSYWHGWRNGRADAGRATVDDAQRQLAHEYVKSVVFARMARRAS